MQHNFNTIAFSLIIELKTYNFVRDKNSPPLGQALFTTTYYLSPYFMRVSMYWPILEVKCLEVLSLELYKNDRSLTVLWGNRVDQVTSPLEDLSPVICRDRVRAVDHKDYINGFLAL